MVFCDHSSYRLDGEDCFKASNPLKWIPITADEGVCAKGPIQVLCVTKTIGLWIHLLLQQIKNYWKQTLGTRCEESEIAHRVAITIENMRHQECEEFLIRISHRCQAFVFCVFCNVLYFFVTKPCETILRNRWLSYLGRVSDWINLDQSRSSIL
jgi:hypothetical protein